MTIGFYLLLCVCVSHNRCRRSSGIQRNCHYLLVDAMMGMYGYHNGIIDYMYRTVRLFNCEDGVSVIVVINF